MVSISEFVKWTGTSMNKKGSGWVYWKYALKKEECSFFYNILILRRPLGEKTVRSLIQVNKVIAQAGVLKELRRIAVLS